MADAVQITRRGAQHQAGSDSLLTGQVFFRLQAQFFENQCIKRYSGILFGLGSTAPEEIVGNTTGGTEDINEEESSETVPNDQMGGDDSGDYGTSDMSGYGELFGNNGDSTQSMFDPSVVGADATGPFFGDSHTTDPSAFYVPTAGGYGG